MDATDSLDLEGRVSNLEGLIVDMLVKTSLVDELDKELKEIKSNKDNRFVKFDDLTVNSLQDMTNYLSEHISSMNYSLITDLHVLLEHIAHNIKASKPTLEFLESTYKLQIPTPNHAITMQSFENSLPRFFCKQKDHKVTKVDESLFDQISSFDEWDAPNYGFRQRLNSEAYYAKVSIENAVREDKSLLHMGRSLALNALYFTTSFLDSLVRCIDNTYRELIRSKYTSKKAWHLVSSLVKRVFLDAYGPRNGILNVMEMKKPHQVATVIYCSCLKSLDVMREYQDHNIDQHPSISSEYIKFISHNTPFDTVEQMESKIKDVEGSIKDFTKNHASHSKQLNTTTQKADSVKTDLGKLEGRVAKLEKK